MSPNQTFKITFRESWNDGAVEQFSESNKVLKFDPAAMRGVMDMFVDGKPLLAHPSEDSIFFLMRDLLSAAERLTTGDSSARVSFYETPYELVFQRNGEVVYLTFYRGGHFPEVMVKDRVLPFVSFVKGILDSANGLLDQVRELDDAADSNPLIQWMQSVGSRLNDTISNADGSTSKPTGIKRIHIESSRWHEPRSENGFSFGFKFVGTSTDLLAPGRPIGNDLNALLFRGQLVVHARERRRIMGEGFLFLQAEKLLAALRKLMSAWEEGRPMSVRLIAEGISIGLKLTSDEKLTVTLANQADDDSIIVLNEMDPLEFADAVLGVAREIRRYIIRQSPKQRKNMRIESFSREIRRLTSMTKEHQRESLINENTARYKQQLHFDAPAHSDVGIGQSRGLVFKEKWRLEAEGLDLGGTLIVGEVGLISARGSILGVELDSGTILWRREIDRGDYRLQSAGRDGFVRVCQNGNVDMMDARTGVLRWRTTLAPRSGGAPVVLVEDSGPLPATIIVAEEDKNLVALDMRTGEIKWRFAVMRGGRFSLRKQGRLLYVSSGDTQFSAIDIEDGHLVWRYIDRIRFFLPPAVWEDQVFEAGGRIGKSEGRLYGFNAFSGECNWNVSLGGGAITAPIAADGVVLVPVVSKGKNDLVAFRAKDGKLLWRIPCDGWADSCSLFATDDKFILNLAGGTVRALNARTGEDAWTTILGPTCSDDIPLGLGVFLRGGALFVPADTIYVLNPNSGEIVHSLGGDPPVPDLLQVNPDCSILVAEESGHIGMYEIARSFTVVNGGV
ncbi:MAG: PQQ-like beta-propeller repeat protein [Deltaproteobacteria bacterium]|nr:PQQ-like beta-propeller repeat protein [Deltaproteobacteria bacterium]MBN2671649.1 PQQ-like beta-propeller repeat protein [Deltaproteobacteria bacterium]